MSKSISIKDRHGKSMTVTRLARDHWQIRLDGSHDLGDEWGLLKGYTIQGAVMCIANARDYGYISRELMCRGANAALCLALTESEYREGVKEMGGLRDNDWIVRRFNGPRPVAVHPAQIGLFGGET